MKLSIALTFGLALAVAGCASASHHVTPPPATQPGAEVATTAPPSQLTDQQITQQLFDAINRERQNNQLKPLTISSELSRSAQEHSDTMQRGAFISTKGESEQGVFQRMSSAGAFQQTSSGHTKTFIGENVLRLRAKPDQLAAQSVGVWMSAPADRKNLLSASFTRTGIGLSRSSDGDYYITQDFAR